MAVKAYVLIETVPGKTDTALRAMKKIAGVKSADVVAGPYDIIAIVQGTDIAGVGDVIKNQVHTVEGVSRTLTCFAV